MAVNRPRSTYQYSNMATRLSGQTSTFKGVTFVCKSSLGLVRRKPRSLFSILIYRTWPIEGVNLKPEWKAYLIKGKSDSS